MMVSGLGGLQPPFSCVLLLAILGYKARYGCVGFDVEILRGRLYARQGARAQNKDTPCLVEHLRGEAVVVGISYNGVPLRRDANAFDELFQFIRTISEVTGFYVSQDLEDPRLFLYEPKITRINAYRHSAVVRAIEGL